MSLRKCTNVMFNSYLGTFQSNKWVEHVRHVMVVAREDGSVTMMAGAMVWWHLVMEMTAVSLGRRLMLIFGIPLHAICNVWLAHDGPEARDRTELFKIYALPCHAYFWYFSCYFCSCMLSEDTLHFVILVFVSSYCIAKLLLNASCYS